MNYSFFDFHGHYLGYMDRGGRLFDSSGSVWARLGDDRWVLDLSGAVRGYVNPQGSFFAPDGSCRGYLRDEAANPPGRAELS